MKIGNLELGNLPLFLAPMEDVTYKSFRHMCKTFGADVMYTEFVASDGLLHDRIRTMQKMEIFEFDRPVAIQIFGHDIETMVAAAKLAEQNNPNFIDINFGCPMKKIVRRGAGSALLQDIPKMVEMAKQIVNAVNLPVTAKTRLGWDENDKPIVDVAEKLQDVGIQALAIHGRTRSQLYTGEANWEYIGKVKNCSRIKIPIIGNGDINGPEKAAKFYQETGVDGLMIGRGAIGRPWIFKEVKHYFETGELLPPPTVPDIIQHVKEQLHVSIEFKNDATRAIFEMRRHFAKYFPGLPNFRELKIALLRAENYIDVIAILDQIAETYQNQSVDYTNMSLK